MESKDVFEHKTRKLIYDYVQTHPGTNISVLKSFFNLNKSTLKYHLVYLEKNKKIRSEISNGKTCFFCLDGANRPNNDLTKTQSRIIAVVKEKPNITQKEIIRKTKKNQKTVSYNLNKLIEMDLIIKEESKGKNHYKEKPKKNVRDQVMKRMIQMLLDNEISPEKFKSMKKRLDEIDPEQ